MKKMMIELDLENEGHAKSFEQWLSLGAEARSPIVLDRTETDGNVVLPDNITQTYDGAYRAVMKCGHYRHARSLKTALWLVSDDPGINCFNCKPTDSGYGKRQNPNYKPRGNKGKENLQADASDRSFGSVLKG